MPAAARLVLDAGQHFFGHARVMFERHRRHRRRRASAKVGHVADQTHKTGQAADAVVAGGERLELGRQVEVFALNAHRHRPSLR